MTGSFVLVWHPVLFAVTILLLVFAMTGASLSMAAVFVLARSARSFQNSLSYPFYLLGGVMVPVALLPVWVQPLSAGVFLSWAADLLRDSLVQGYVEDQLFRLAMLAGLGFVSFVAGSALVKASVNRLRRTGRMTYA
nr:ABC transporter permease [Arthrobacter sp. H5]